MSNIEKHYKYVKNDITYIVYPLSHILIGIISTKYRSLLLLFLLYQILQLVLGIRFFALHTTITKDNNTSHTIRKLCEFTLGYTIGLYLQSK